LVSLALLEYFIHFFVLEKVVRQAEDCVTNVITKELESGGKFACGWFLEPIAEILAKQKKVTSSKAHETND
jgi:hypothetical protein